MERKLTCIVCPLGCEINVQLADKDAVCVTGNSCPRGAEYARNECTNPKRTVTSTVRCTDGSLVSVKTDRAIPKEKMAECMALINQAVATLPVTIGDVILADVFGSNVVATQNRNLDE